MKVKITLSYDGSKFHGFQAQRDGTKTVANTLENAFKSLNINNHFNASGRTDTGVHATNQVIDIKLPDHWQDLAKLQNYLNNLIRPEILIKSIVEVEEGFHARYSAKRRVYRYLIKDDLGSVFLNSYIHFHKGIDAKKIDEASKLFVGVHDFSNFMKMGSDSGSCVREVYSCRFYKHKDIYVFVVEANGFLRSQIRMMFSFLLKINDGELTKNDLIDQLELKSMKSTTLAPANGLYLSKIKY